MKNLKLFSNTDSLDAWRFGDNYATPNIVLLNDEVQIDVQGLPYDNKLLYLESSGTSYIDTEFYPTQNSRCIVQGQIMNGLYPDCVGTLQGSAKRFQVVAIYQGNFHMGVGNGWKNIKSVDNDIHTFDVSGNGIIKLDDATYNMSTDGNAYNTEYTFSCPYSLLLFATNNNGIKYSYQFRIYSCQIYENNTLLFDLIPVKKDGVGYLYNKVTKQLLGNSGSGDFILGPDTI